MTPLAYPGGIQDLIQALHRTRDQIHTHQAVTYQATEGLERAEDQRFVVTCLKLAILSINAATDYLDLIRRQSAM